jgi:hypothetical protein
MKKPQGKKLKDVRKINAKTMAKKGDLEKYMHCGRCDAELPNGVSPREYANFEVGVTNDGKLVVRCVRHDLLLLTLKLDLDDPETQMQVSMPLSCGCDEKKDIE